MKKAKGLELPSKAYDDPDEKRDPVSKPVGRGPKNDKDAEDK
jgi:hypothetical protein